jgi:uncharacterized membrane protein
VTIVGLVALWPRGEIGDTLNQVGVISEQYDGRVQTVVEEPCPGSDPAAPVLCQSVTMVLLGGPDQGDQVGLQFPIGRSTPRLEPGDTVVLGHQPDAQPGFEYVYLDRQRKPVLAILAIFFALVVVLLGRMRGVGALLGLAGSFAVILVFVLPAILEGRDPALVSIVGASVIAFLALYLSNGFTAMTSVALLGTLGSLALTALLAYVFTRLSQFTGVFSEESALVTLGAGQVDLSGLFLGGVVIGALGAIDDMTVTQASAVWELRAAKPDQDPGSLFHAGLRIGRDHVASTVNTLFLAYAGASMPLLLLFVLSHQTLGSVANSEVVATEIVRTLVGSIGLVASVPLTTWLAARARRASPEARGSGRSAHRRGLVSKLLGLEKRRRLQDDPTALFDDIQGTSALADDGEEQAHDTPTPR